MPPLCSVAVVLRLAADNYICISFMQMHLNFTRTTMKKEEEEAVGDDKEFHYFPFAVRSRNKVFE